MLPPKDRLTICFAHHAYRMAERFARRNTGISHLEVRSSEELAQRLPEAEVLVVSGLWKNELAPIAGKLRFIQSISAGTDQFDKALLRDRGIRLASAAGVNAQAVAEHAVALMLAGVSLAFARRYAEAVNAFADAKALGLEDVSINMWLGITYYLSGDLQRARAACEGAGEVNGPWCLAMVYEKLGQRAEAETMLARVRALGGERLAEGYADIYAQWGDSARALDWLEKAMRNRDPYLAYTKVNPFFDPLRKEPRFQVIEQALKFPD